jgi:ABC-type glycerol-3-phosphate transport system substrate-binding protein
MIRIITGSRVQRHRAGLVLIGALLLVLALALTACSAGAGSSGTTTRANNGASHSSITARQLQNADQQIQNVVQTMNNAANDAQNSDSTTGVDSNPQP